MNKIDGSNLTWSFNPDSGTLRFEGMGLLPDYLNLLETSSMSGGVGKDERDAMVPWGEHVDKIRHLESEGLLEVPPSMFAWLPGLEAVLLPSVRIIGNGSFYDCPSLAWIDMPKVLAIGNGAFERCSSLVGTSSSDSKMVMRKLRYIGSYAFRGCKSITAVTLIRSKRKTKEGKYIQESGSVLDYVGRAAFAECSSLVKFHVGGKTCNAVYGEQVFYGCRHLDESEEW